MSDGYIKLHRLLLDWEWFSTPNMVTLWIYCLLRSSHKEHSYKGTTLKEGQFIDGRKAISARTGLSEQQVRTCLERLKSTKEITTESMGNFTLFTLNSWKKYQLSENDNQGNNHALTNDQPTINQGLTTYKNGKNGYNGKNGKNNTPPTPKTGVIEDSRFLEFWDAYPKKVDRRGSYRSFLKALKSTTLGTILLAIEQKKKSDQWAKNGGQYIPNPTTWLNQERWNDVTEEVEDTQSWAYLQKQLENEFRGSNESTNLIG